MSNNNTTIAVAMSGGVDSSVSAALLKEQGYNVLGFFMKNWGDDTHGLKKSECPWLQDREDAMRVAAKLDIPFHTLDFEDEYRKQVLDYFFREYKLGRTPNPDIMCNAEIKFGVFLRKAVRLGADMIATGHYTRTSHVILNKRLDVPIEECSEGSRESRASFDEGILRSTPAGYSSRSSQDDGVIQLLKGVDQNKDQSYFLYRLNQEQLSKAMFPVGEYEKTEVRKLAKKFGLPNHDKRDSQGVCFIGHLDLRKFLSQKIEEEPGDIVLISAGADNHLPVRKIGAHKGLFWYTIGQRKGINVGGIGPFYVVKKDLKKNQLIVTNNPKDERLYSSSVVIEDVNWISGRDVTHRVSVDCDARIRYREKLTKCTIEDVQGGKYKVKFKEPQYAVASGQSAVFYDGDVCLGGGVIV